jgi:hypothetical protein
MARGWKIIELPMGKWCWERLISGRTTAILGPFNSREECEKSARNTGLIHEDLERRARPAWDSRSGRSGFNQGRRARPRDDRDRRQSP